MKREAEYAQDRHTSALPWAKVVEKELRVVHPTHSYIASVSAMRKQRAHVWVEQALLARNL